MLTKGILLSDECVLSLSFVLVEWVVVVVVVLEVVALVSFISKPPKKITENGSRRL